MAILPLFPTQVYKKRIMKKNLLMKELLKEVYQFQRMDEQGRKWSKKNYPGGYTSYGSLDHVHEISSSFAALKKLLDRQATSFAKQLQMDVSKGSLQICSMWINIMPKGVSHSMHIHPHAVISGTFYLQVPRGSRGLKLEDPRLGFYMNTPPRKANAKQENQWFVELKPQVGEVILFESWLRHEVPAHTVKQDRISISFNYDWF